MKRARSKGSLLVLTLLLSSALIFFGMAFYSLFAGNRSIQQHAEARLIAEAAATAGIEDSLYQLKKSSSWTSGFDSSVLPHSNATYSMSFSKTQTKVPYSTNNLAGSTSVAGYGGRVIPAYSAHLVAVGAYGSASVTEEAIVSNGSFSFKYSLFGSQSINFANSATTDSYDSSKGIYSTTRQSTGGDIATNSTTSGSINLKNNSVVGGDVVIGPGGTSAVVKSTGGIYTQLDVATSLVSMVPPVAPTGTSLGDVTISGSSNTLAPGIYGQLTLTNDSTLTLSKGTYVFANIVSKGQDVKLNASSGPVTIYFSGKVDLG